MKPPGPEDVLHGGKGPTAVPRAGQVLRGACPARFFGPLSISPPFVRRPGRSQERDLVRTREETTMRFMVMVKANRDSEAGVLPDEKILAAMGKFNEELVKAGVMLAGEGL